MPVKMKSVHVHKKCLKSVITREMKIKTIIRYYYIPIRTAKIKKTDTSGVARGYGATGNPIRC